MRRPLALLLALTLTLAACDLGEDETTPPQAGVGVEADEEQAAEKLGFPASATRNTVRVGGADAAADAAGVANALYPATGDADRPTAVVLVDQEDWITGIAASVLAGPPIGAPILLSDGSELPTATEETLERLEPKGSDLSEDAQVIRLGPDIPRPEGFRTAVVEGDTPFARAAAIDRFFSAARGRPSNDILLYSGEQPEWAMPAAAWAARSGDSVLPVRRDGIPAPVLDAIREHENPNVFVLGSEQVISERVVRQLEGEQAQGGKQGKKKDRPTGHRPRGRADRGRHTRRERDRLRALREGRLRLGSGGARVQLRPRQRVAAARRPRGGRARHARRVRPVAPHR